MEYKIFRILLKHVGDHLSVFFNFHDCTFNQKKIKRSKNMSCECALNFDQWKTFSENYKPIAVWTWLAYIFTENNCHLRLFSQFIQTQNTYPNLKTTSHIRPKLFLSTKYLENSLVVKCLISVAAALRLSWNLLTKKCKTKINFNFFFLSGIGTRTVNVDFFTLKHIS